MMYSAAAFVLILSIVAALPADVYKTEWNRFKNKFQRVYPTQEEENMRYRIFSDRLESIINNNELYRKGKVSFLMEVNGFSDWTVEEMKRFFNDILPTFFIPTNEIKPEWESFKKTFHKNYPNKEEEDKHFQIFVKKFEDVVKHNKLYDRGLSPFKMAVNRFSDMTSDEIRKEMGFLPNPVM